MWALMKPRYPETSAMGTLHLATIASACGAFRNEFRPHPSKPTSTKAPVPSASHHARMSDTGPIS